MHFSVPYFKLASIVGATVLLVACSGASQPSSMPAGTVAAPSIRVISELVSGGRARVTPDAARALLYAAVLNNNAVEIYRQKGQNQKPIGQIGGLNEPYTGLFVDGARNLYVCNYGNGTVAVYARGKTAPFETLTQAGTPGAVVVGSDGTVYVANRSNGYNGSILVYPAKQTTPSGSLYTFTGGAYPISMALNSKKTILYIGFDLAAGGNGEVESVQLGSKKPTNLGITVGTAGGIAIDNKKNLLLVDGLVPAVDVFPPGSTTPSQQITGFQGAAGIALNHDNTELWVAEGLNNNIAGVTYPAGSIVDTITVGTGVFDVATSPTNPH
jgi:serine/threonine-protein kinase